MNAPGLVAAFDVDRRKRRVYASLMGVTTFAAVTAVALQRLLGSPDPTALGPAVGAGLVAFTLALAALVRQIPTRAIEHVVLWSMTAFLIGSLALRLYVVPPAPTTPDAVAMLLLWLPLPFVFCGIAFERPIALRWACVLLGLVVVSTLPHAVFGIGLSATPMLRPAVALQAYLAYGVLVVALHFLAGLRQRAAALEETATAMRRLANTDALTGLANRRQAEDQLEREVRRAERYGRAFSALMLDIDRFKDLNDRFGHQAGDAVLVDLARRLEGLVRASDLVARWGGEEFVLLAPETDLDDASRLAELVRRHVDQHDLVGRYQVSVSVGVGSYRPGDTVASLIARTDAALYLAKRSGRNQVRAEVLPAAAAG